MPSDRVGDPHGIRHATALRPALPRCSYTSWFQPSPRMRPCQPAPESHLTDQDAPMFGASLVTTPRELCRQQEDLPRPIIA